MILFIDPLLFVIAKKRSISNLSVIKSLKETFDDLYQINEEVISLVDEIMIVNPLGQMYELTTNTYAMFLESLKLKSAKAKLLKQLFSNARIRNIKDQQSQIDLFSWLSSDLKNREFIFFTSLLNIFIVSIYLILKKVEGHRIIQRPNKIYCEKIESAERYLVCAFSLSISELTTKEFNEILEGTLSLYTTAFWEVIKEDIKSGEANCHIIYPDSDGRFWDDNFEKNIIKEFGDFKVFRCKSYYIKPPPVEQLFVYDLEKLPETDQLLLLDSISSGNYKVVIIFANDFIDVRGFHRIRTTLSPSNNSETRFSQYCRSEIIKNGRIIQRKYEEIKLIISMLSENEKAKNHLINRLNSFYLTSYKLEHESIDFWYNLEDLEFFKLEQPEKFLSELLTDQIVESSFSRYKFHHNKDKKVWEIQINGNKLPDIPYSGSKGLKYIVYLHEHYKDKTILDTHLRTIVDKWDNTKQIKTTSTLKSTDAKKIKQDIDYICKNENYPALKPLADIVKISSKSSGCYYKTDSGIILDITDKDLPDPY